MSSPRADPAQVFIVSIQVQDSGIAAVSRRIAAELPDANLTDDDDDDDDGGDDDIISSEPAIRRWSRRELEEIVPGCGISLIVEGSQAAASAMYGHGRTNEEIMQQVRQFAREENPHAIQVLAFVLYFQVLYFI